MDTDEKQRKSKQNLFFSETRIRKPLHNLFTFKRKKKLKFHHN